MSACGHIWWHSLFILGLRLRLRLRRRLLNGGRLLGHGVAALPRWRLLLLLLFWPRGVIRLFGFEVAGI